MSEAEASTSTSSNVNITQVLPWLTRYVGQESLFLKPKDLRLIYIIFLWEFIRGIADKAAVRSDADINVPQATLEKIVQLTLNVNNNKLFNGLNDL